MRYLGQALVGLEYEHPELQDMRQRLADSLLTLWISTTAGGDTWPEWDFYLQRARELVEQTHAVLLLASQRYYGRALALVRSALEQMCLDRLMLSGAVSVLMDMEQPQFAQDAVIVKDSSGEALRVLSPYFRLLNYHSEIRTPGLSTERLDALDGRDADTVRQWAEEFNRQRRPFLGWRQMCRNILASGIYGELQCHRLDDHYRFLSQFVHPAGGEQFMIRCYCERSNDGELHEEDYHIFGELVLLYLINVLANELEAVVDYFEEVPRLSRAETGRNRKLIEQARDLAGELWFPPTGPSSLDRIHTANRIWRELSKEDRRASLETREPDDLLESEIDIEMNMLKRLHDLHQPHRWAPSVDKS